MALYEYSAFDGHGKKHRGVVEALSQKAASRKLREQDLFPTNLLAVSTGVVGGQRSFVRRVSAEQLGVATRQLATMLAAGMPLDEALVMVSEQQTQGTLGAVLTRVRDDVLQGSSLHESLQTHPKIFSPLYTNMVRVGEASGNLDKVLLQLAEFTDEQSRLNSQFKAALTYPVMMFFVGSGVLMFLLAFVVPKITRMLEDLDQALPVPTMLLIATSSFLAQYWWLMVLLVVGIVLLLRRYAQTAAGRLWFDQKKYRVPLFGNLALLNATSRFARTTATLLHSGVPLLDALEIVQNLLGNTHLQQAMEVVREKVVEGAGLSEPLLQVDVFPAMLPQMAAVGERSGELEGMLFKVAEIYEHQVKTKMDGLMALLEPLMILVMGTVVGFIVLAILLPIFQASQGIS